MGVVKKVAKKVFKGVKKVVKGVGKAIKKVGSGIVKGVKKVVGGIGKVFGKLGPVGMIAMSFVLPGIGSMLAGAWSGAASALGAYSGMGAGFVNAIGQGMTYAANIASKVGGFISKGTGAITDKITGGLKWIGGKVADGANYLFKGAQQFAGVKNPMSIGDVGKWVGDKAKSIFNVESAATQGGQQVAGGTLNTGQFMPQEGWSAATTEQTAAQFGEAGGYFQNGQLSNVAGADGTVNLSGLSDIPKGSIVGQKSYLTDGAMGIGPNEILDTGGIDITPRGTPYDPNATLRYNIEPGSVAGNVPIAQTPGQLGVTGQALGNKGFDLMGAITRMGGSLLNSYAQGGIQQQPAYQPTYIMAGGAGGEDPFGSMRAGVGGHGASGGTFLNQAQMQQQALLSEQLAQLG